MLLSHACQWLDFALTSTGFNTQHIYYNNVLYRCSNRSLSQSSPLGLVHGHRNLHKTPHDYVNSINIWAFFISRMYTFNYLREKWWGSCILVILSGQYYLLSFHVWFPDLSRRYWFIPFCSLHFSILLQLQDSSVKGAVVVTYLKSSSRLFVCTPFSPWAAAAQLSQWRVKMSLADKPVPVAHRVASNHSLAELGHSKVWCCPSRIHPRLNHEHITCQVYFLLWIDSNSLVLPGRTN